MIDKYSDHLIVFTRYPIPGKTKTRLIPILGPEGAANLTRRMAEHIVEVAKNFKNRHYAFIELRYTDGKKKIVRDWLGGDIDIHPQGQGDLGDKIYEAFSDAFNEGAKRIVVVGTDCHEITPDILHEAFEALTEHDLVLGPADDGGYYLIGMKHPIPDLFENIDWGTDKVFTQTMSIAASKKLSVKFLETLADIDVPEDLPLLTRRMKNITERSISVIIPTMNEAANLAATIFSLHWAKDIEIIVADGGSTDNTVEIAKAIGVKVLEVPGPRSDRLNAGAAAAKGDTLLFLHADTVLPKNFKKSIRSTLSTKGVAGGAFSLNIEGGKLGFRVIEKLANWRSRKLQKPYGDQAIFLKKKTFQKLGGFNSLPLMDDYEFIRRLKKLGRIVTVPMPAKTSGRRWQEKGLIKTTLLNQAVILGYHCGVSPTRLKKWYS